MATFCSSCSTTSPIRGPIRAGRPTASAPIFNRFVSEVAARFGLVVTERAAASAIPVVGAVGGAALNVVFMNYFQELARGHFVVRRLERIYGAEAVKREYECLAQERRGALLMPLNRGT